MTIDRLGPLDPLSKYNKTDKIEKLAKETAVDSVAVSEEARHSAALRLAADIVRSVPDVRMDRVEAVKAKLQKPDYVNDAVINAVADRLLDVFGV